MRLRFRTKLLTIMGIAALSFVVLIIVTSLMARAAESQLELIAKHHIPRLALEPKLKAQCERVPRALQDAVAAQDASALAQTHVAQEGCLATLAEASDLVPTAQAAVLREALVTYFDSAYDVSRRLIAGETGEQLVSAIASMQLQHRLALERLDETTRFDQHALERAFAAASAAQATTSRVQQLVSFGCLTVVLILSMWVSRDVLHALSQLGAGVVRFGRGDFSEPIPSTGADEFGALAREANQMAENLKLLGEERDRADWLKAGHAGLVLELRGSLEPEAAAAQATRFIARYLEAPAAALYWANDDGTFRLLGHYASFGGAAEDAPLVHVQAGQGLLGQSTREQDITIVRDLPDDYFPIRSGLGRSKPRAVVLLPLLYLDKVMGVLELAVLGPWSELASELLRSVRETLAITIEVARGRSALRTLLAETQQQAKRLAAQEDVLRSNNDALQAQQQELKTANNELIQQASELERQRHWLEQSNGELREARKRLERQAEELQRVSAYKSQFLANMSHELRTPLNSMLVLSNVLAENKEGNLRPKQVEFCNTIHGAGQALLALINQVLDLSKVEAGKQQIRAAPVKLQELASYARRIFEPLAHDKQLTFTVDVEGSVPDTIVTDPQRIEQILNNLLGNAIKFTEHGAVSLRIAPPPVGSVLRRATLRPDQTVAFSVTDTGIGIPEAHQARIFAPFEQLDARPERRYGGTGLGLSIARELADLLGGELAVESVPGEGSIFTCYLPLALPDAQTDDDSPMPEPRAWVRDAQPESIDAPRMAVTEPVAGLATAASAVDVLVIEDDPIFAEMLSDVVIAQGLTARIAPDGATGLRLARECAPGGIILDVKLSDTDGFAVMAQLQADHTTSAIPVHFVSALDGAERGLALGAIGYLTKPATRTDLVRVVESLTGGARKGVLIVANDAVLVGSLCEQLAQEGFTATHVCSAEEALALCAREVFSCLILDIGPSCTEALNFLQTLEQQRGVAMPHVLVYTNRPLSKDEVQGLEAHAEAVVEREGLATERLLDEVRQFARGRRGGGASRRKPPKAPPTVELQGRTILVADDDMRTVYALSAMLRAQGASVLVADTGHAALSVLAEHPETELVLMDIMMPEMDGFEATRRIRHQEATRTLPLIALTDKAMRVGREHCMQAGASGYLVKPIDADRLLAAIETQLSLGQRPAVPEAERAHRDEAAARGNA